jgi:hypothetical protein
MSSFQWRPPKNTTDGGSVELSFGEVALPKHSKNCVCKACCAARLASPKAPDPLQGDLLASVKTDSTRSSLERCSFCGLTREEKDAATSRGAAVCISSCRWADYMPPSGQSLGLERKEVALTAHDQRRRATLLWLRGELRGLYLQRARGDHGLTWRQNPYVTADDAERLLDQHSDNAIEGNGSWKGALFRGPHWKWNGQLIPSVQAQNNARGQRAWRYVGP